MADPTTREFFRPERVLAFSDGVYAVVITLLVIDLRLPSGQSESSDAALLQALLSMGPKLFIFAFTFVIIGMSWLGHHRKFSYIRQVDGGLLWLNLFFLLTLCLVPFATSVLSEQGGRLGFILYAVVMTLVLLLSSVLSAYGLRRPFLTEPGPPRGIRQDLTLSPLLTGAIFLLSAAVAGSGRVGGAHWMLLSIVPVSAFFGTRSRKRI